MQRLYALLIVIVILVGSVSYLYWQNTKRPTGPKIGDSFPIDSLLRDAEKKDLTAQFYLVKFWGSWCGPCRREHPQWVAVYETYKNMKQSHTVLAVIGVALEADSSSWEAALREDQLPWDGHIVQDQNLKKGWARRVQVKNIPENILLDKAGLVLGRDMTPTEVERFIRHRLTE